MKVKDLIKTLEKLEQEREVYAYVFNPYEKDFARSLEGIEMIKDFNEPPYFEVITDENYEKVDMHSYIIY